MIRKVAFLSLFLIATTQPMERELDHHDDSFISKVHSLWNSPLVNASILCSLPAISACNLGKLLLSKSISPAQKSTLSFFFAWGIYSYWWGSEDIRQKNYHPKSEFRMRIRDIPGLTALLIIMGYGAVHK